MAIGRKGFKRQGVTEASDEPSLNREVELEDIKTAEKLLKTAETKEFLETVWVCGLDHGTHLFNDRMDLDKCIDFTRKADLVSKGRDGHIDEVQYTHMFAAVVPNGKFMYFDGFVRLLFHISMYRCDINDRVGALRACIEKYLRKYVQNTQNNNEHDGCVAGKVLAESLPEKYSLSALFDIDRILFIYDLPLSKMFKKYRTAYTHQGRTDLSFEQLKQLDETVEVEELKEAMKDFGVFPKQMAFIDIARVMSWVCFEKELDSILKRQKTDEKEDGEGDARSVAMSEDVSVFSDGSTMATLDRQQFFECIVRVGQMVFSKPPYNRRLMTMAARVEQLLKTFEPHYFRVFGVNMVDDCDYTTKGLPKFTGCQPTRGHIDGGYDVVVTGSNFCEKRGVWVKFGDNEATVRSHTIRPRNVIIRAPAVAPDSVYVDVEMDSAMGLYEVRIFRTAQMKIEISNDRREYTISDPPVKFMFENPLPPFHLNEEVQSKLLKLFVAACSTGDRYNTKYMIKEKWKKFKKDHEVEEPTQKFTDPDDEDRIIVEEDPFFQDIAEMHDYTRQQLTVDFQGFLRLLVRIFAATEGADPQQELQTIVDRGDKYVASGLQDQQDQQEDELSQAKTLLRLIQRKSTRTLDVYCGPVLCCKIVDRAGPFTGMTRSNMYKGKRHKFVTYSHYDLNTEERVLNHVQMSESFSHLTSRLLLDGFDLASSSDPSTRRPTGRCWRIFREERPGRGSKESERVGSLWDYPGHFSNLDWQPADVDAANTALTVSVYRKEEELDFLYIFLAFNRAKTISQMRTLLQQRGFTLETCLYRL